MKDFQFDLPSKDITNLMEVMLRYSSGGASRGMMLVLVDPITSKCRVSEFYSKERLQEDLKKSDSVVTNTYRKCLDVIENYNPKTHFAVCMLQEVKGFLGFIDILTFPLSRPPFTLEEEEYSQQLAVRVWRDNLDKNSVVKAKWKAAQDKQKRDLEVWKYDMIQNLDKVPFHMRETIIERLGFIPDQWKTGSP